MPLSCIKYEELDKSNFNNNSWDNLFNKHSNINSIILNERRTDRNRDASRNNVFNNIWNLQTNQIIQETQIAQIQLPFSKKW